MPAVDYVPRLVDPLLDELLSEVAAVLIVGPRASGKTTTAERRAHAALRLGVSSEARAVAADPDAVLRSLERPLLIDEWQVVPDVLGAVKRAVDGGAAAGSFLLTGSSRADLQAEGWPATGRLIRVPMYGLTQRERVGQSMSPSLVDRLFAGDFEVANPSEPPDLRDYLDFALRGGFPEASRLQSDRVRRAWLSSYVDQLVLRDIPLAGEERDPARLRRYLRVLAANTAGVANHRSLYEAAGLNRLTAVAYDGVLELLYITEQVPAWSHSHFTRLNQSPKRYMVDPALLGPLLNVDSRAIMRSADLLGRVVDTFVYNQLRVECSIAAAEPSIFHLRRSDSRHEIDLILEGPGGALIAIEVKAAASVDRADARHLKWFRDEAPEQFACGVIFHTGRFVQRIDENILALPIATLWR